MSSNKTVIALLKGTEKCTSLHTPAPETVTGDGATPRVSEHVTGGSDDSRKAPKTDSGKGAPTQKNCLFFLQGKCKFGTKCQNLHDPEAKTRADEKAAKAAHWKAKAAKAAVTAAAAPATELEKAVFRACQDNVENILTVILEGGWNEDFMAYAQKCVQDGYNRIGFSILPEMVMNAIMAPEVCSMASEDLALTRRVVCDAMRTRLPAGASQEYTHVYYGVARKFKDGRPRFALEAALRKLTNKDPMTNACLSKISTTTKVFEHKEDGSITFYLPSSILELFPIIRGIRGAKSALDAAIEAARAEGYGAAYAEAQAKGFQLGYAQGQAETFATAACVAAQVLMTVPVTPEAVVAGTGQDTVPKDMRPRGGSWQTRDAAGKGQGKYVEKTPKGKGKAAGKAREGARA